ncbi:glycosyl hydrolase [Candidatus Bathyarchaeota archaeon]|nr:glycosyl hydrolase [Candidatus Bathyarchaeota archaeon]
MVKKLERKCTMMQESTTAWKIACDQARTDIDGAIQNLLGKMRLEEKVNQMSGDWGLIPGIVKLLRRYCDPPVPAGECKRLSIPPIRFVDGPRGIVAGRSTCFPVPMCRGATWDLELERRIGVAMGLEARANGANYFGGVCINLLRHPAWGRAQETYGEDPFLLGRMGSALTRGVQSTGIMACAKHFALNSIENSRFKVNVQASERVLREIYLPHFKACVDTGVASIMGAYNKFRAHHCCQSAYLLRDILKNEWKFDGFVISDFLLGVRNAEKAIRAGLDIEMPVRWRMRPRKLLRLIKRGTITLDLVEKACTRIIRKKLEFLNGDGKPRNRGGFNSPAVTDSSIIACQAHVALAREAAVKGMVLLENRKNFLPLNKGGEVGTIGMFGKLSNAENIGDHGSSQVHPPHVVTPLQGIRAACREKNIEVVHDGSGKVRKAQQRAREVDACIIVVGCSHKQEGENLLTHGGDRHAIALDRRDEELIDTIAAENEKTIVVLQGGGSFLTNPWSDMVQGLIMAWYGGMEGGNALAALLLGDANFSGRLPCTFYEQASDMPYFSSKDKTMIYGRYHGYTLLDKEQKRAKYPFGHGGSYTNHVYSDLELDDVIPKARVDGRIATIMINVENKGTMLAEDVVQVYLGKRNRVVDRPEKLLCGFQRVTVEPGEAKRVCIDVHSKAAARYDPSNGGWIVDPGDYQLLVGPSSATEKLLGKNITLE